VAKCEVGRREWFGEERERNQSVQDHFLAGSTPCMSNFPNTSSIFFFNYILNSIRLSRGNLPQQKKSKGKIKG